MTAATVALIAPLVALAAAAEPVRSHDRWAIHAQASPDDWQAVVQGTNLAAGRPTVLKPEPNYSPPRDDADASQLTDGRTSNRQDGHLWQDKRSVGWAYQSCARITIDLGESLSVGRVVARLQTSIQGTSTCPKTIEVAVSDDAEYFQPVLSLSEQVHPEDNPALTFAPLPAAGAGVHAFVLDVGYRARYVRLDLATRKHLICDEIAVTAAESAVLPLPPAPAVEREYRDNVFDRREQFATLTAPGNLIAGKALRYAPEPNYRLTTDDNDPLDLTDGELGQRTDERIWFEKSSVCWQHAPLVSIFADLGEPRPIDSVVFRLLGGGEQGSLLFPDEVRVLLSTDGTDYCRVSSRHKRGLDDLSSEAWDLPEENLAWVHNFRLAVEARARYVAVQVVCRRQFVCSDQLAIVKGRDNLPGFQPAPAKQVVIVTAGVAFSSHHARHPVCANMPLRTKVALLDARSGKAFNGPCKLLLDLPETVRLVTDGYEGVAVRHGGKPFRRYAITCNRGKVADFYLQSLLPAGEGGTLYMSGDSGNGPENERRIAWESIDIPASRQCKRLHVSLAWMGLNTWGRDWPDGIGALRHVGFNAVGCFPRYWKDGDLPQYRERLQAARDAGMAILVNESPAGARSRDRKQPETKSALRDGPGKHVCPAYRGQYYRKEHESFGDHAVWCGPDLVFFDIEAYWNGSTEAPRCERCKKRFTEGGFDDWDEFRAAMGREIHEDMKGAVDEALARAGVRREVVYGSYRTQPITKLNDGLFRWSNLYPDLLQIAMPSLYVVGNQMAVANSIAANRAAMKRNDIIPWLSTGTYGQFGPERTRDMVLAALANGARGITYYCYRDFDPLHFKYHSQAVDIVAPVEDIFVDGAPIAGLSCDRPNVKLCGMAAAGEMAVLVSNYAGLSPETRVRVSVPQQARSQVWDLHARTCIATLQPGGTFDVAVGDIRAHLFYVGSKYAGAVGE